MSHIHVCLVSKEPIPNLIPIQLMEVKPRKVVLFVSRDMYVQSERLKAVIKSWGIATEEYPIEPYDFELAHTAYNKVLDKFHPDEVILNVTGGTKIMAISAFNVFRDKEVPIVYVDTQNKKIYKFMHTAPMEKVNFKGVIKVAPYLYAYGQKIVEKHAEVQHSEKRKTVIDELLKNIDRYQNAFSVLNGYASKARNSKNYPCRMQIEERDFRSMDISDLVRLYEKNGLLKLNKKELVFHSKPSADFVSGGWLEEYVHSVVKTLNPTDILMNVKTEWDQKAEKPPTNEYDVIFTYNNQLFIIECKTKRFEGKDIETSSAEPIYKLDSLKDYAGGLYGRGMIVSYKKLTDDQKSRLKAFKLEYCEGVNLNNLGNQIKIWLNK